MTHEILDLLTYWESPFGGQFGDDAVSDGHTPEHRLAAAELVRAGGPWDEEILGSRPPHIPLSWEPFEDDD